VVSCCCFFIFFEGPAAGDGADDEEEEDEAADFGFEDFPAAGAVALPPRCCCAVFEVRGACMALFVWLSLSFPT
jgi:hypothetical protein